jgi:hypothetical protein
MKKLILSLLGLVTVATVHAQQTVVIERPGIFTDLANAATALVTLPAAAATGIIVGTVEGVRDIVTGSTTVVTTPAPVVVAPRIVVPSAPVVVPSAPVVVPSAPVIVPPPAAVTPAPAVVAPAVVAPAAVPSTTIITRYGDGSATIVTRQASAYELGPNVLVPVDPAHRVGSSPHVNPYVFRYR